MKVAAKLGKFGVGAMLLMAAIAAPAQTYPVNYPVKPVRVIVPFAPGGGKIGRAHV